MSRKHDTIFFIALYGIYTALVFVLTFVPYLGYISFGVVSATTIHLAVLVFTYLAGFKHSIGFGAIFGLSSLIRVAVSPTGVFDYCFINPLVSVLPRILFALFAGVLFDLCKKIDNKALRFTLVVLISIVSTLIHTILVLGMCGILYFNKLNEAYLDSGGFWVVMSSILLFNTLPEMALAGVCVLPMGEALNIPYKRARGNENKKVIEGE